MKSAEPPREFTDQLHEAFTRTVLQSPSWLAVFQITDVFGMTARFNTPGSVAPTNWSYRLPQTVKELDEDPVLAAADADVLPPRAGEWARELKSWLARRASVLSQNCLYTREPTRQRTAAVQDADAGSNAPEFAQRLGLRLSLPLSGRRERLLVTLRHQIWPKPV